MNNSNLKAVIIERKIERPPISVAFPEVSGLRNREVQAQINQLIRQLVENMIILQDGNNSDLEEMLGVYKITLNEKGPLSIRFENYAYIRMAAHGSTIVKSLTIDLANARVYRLRDLFKPGSEYRYIINKQIERQIKERNIPLLEDFTGISDNQEFYLTNNTLVIYFQKYELAPGYLGIVEFPIPYTYLVNVIAKNGPLAKLI